MSEMSTKGHKHKLSANERYLNEETKIVYNKEAGDTVSMNSGSHESGNVENGIEATNSTSEAALSATMDEFRRVLPLKFSPLVLPLAFTISIGFETVISAPLSFVYFAFCTAPLSVFFILLFIGSPLALSPL